jgi:uncharacterized NAD(P)/FAD-binding protein YdhS
MSVTIDRSSTTIAHGAIPRVAIIGGGASGLTVAAQLLRNSPTPVHVVLFEPREHLGEGIAYQTHDPLHLLNVPACGMSALAEDLDHFRRWADCADTDFLPRADYADYLKFVLAEAQALAVPGSRFDHVRQTVADVTHDGHPTVVTTFGVAIGHNAPVVPLEVELACLPPALLIRDPWAPGAFDSIGEGEEILVIGTGLTFVDAALTIAAIAPDARIHGVSRHGLLPREHEDPWQPRIAPPPAADFGGDPRRVLAYLRGFGNEWRKGVDSLRPITNQLWKDMEPEQRASFQCLLGRFWEVYRHRMAPQSARAIAALSASGALTVQSTEVTAVEQAGTRLHVSLADESVCVVDRIVICTGPSGDMRSNFLGDSLISTGLAQSGPGELGFLVDEATGALIASDQQADDRLLTIGPLRRGVLFESTAMPEIRAQAAEIVQQLAAMTADRRVARM